MLESRFGHDFGRVRVHADERAARSARAVGAQAYTVGEDLVFARGKFNPGTQEGRHLLAHELTHVVQQRGAPASRSFRSGDTGAALEREAEAASAALVGAAGPIRTGGRAGSLQLQRQPSGEDESVAVQEEEEEEETEVRDGDEPVVGVTEAPDEGLAEDEMLLAQAGEGEVFAAKGGSKGRKGTPPPKAKRPRNTITKIDVDLSAQEMTLTWKDGTTEKRTISSGKGLPNTKEDPCKTQEEENCTPTGTFQVGHRGNKDTKNSKGDRMAWFVALKGDTGPRGDAEARGIGIHNSQPAFGRPASHGCIRVGAGEEAMAFSKKVNQGVVPGVTVITVTGKAPTKPWSKAKKKKKGSAPKKKKKP